MLNDQDKQYFLDRVVKQENGCWMWTGSMSGGAASYPCTMLHDSELKRPVRASARRVAWLLYKNANEAGGIIKCDSDNLCVNPDHLKVNHSRVSDFSEEHIESLRRGVQRYLHGRRRKVSLY